MRVATSTSPSPVVPSISACVTSARTDTASVPSARRRRSSSNPHSPTRSGSRLAQTVDRSRAARQASGSKTAATTSFSPTAVPQFSTNKEDAVAYANHHDDVPSYSSLRHTGYLLLHGRRMWLPVLLALGYASPLMPFLTALAGSYASMLYLSMAVLLQRCVISGGRHTHHKDMRGYTCVVTGGTSGIGLYTAMQLLNMGAHVILLGKSGSESAAMDFLQAHCSRFPRECLGQQQATSPTSSTDTGARDAPSGAAAVPLEERVAFVAVNLGDPLEVMAAAARIRTLTDNRLDVLVNAAAVWTEEPGSNRDGVEEHIAVNFLGPFHLTESLLPALRRATHRHGRVVYVTCAAHNGVRTPHVVQERMMLRPEEGLDQQITARCYSASKLGNIYHAQSIASRRREGLPSSSALLHEPRLSSTGVTRSSKPDTEAMLHPVDVCCVDPGFCATGLQHSGHADKDAGTTGGGMVARTLKSLWCKTAYEGSQSVVYCCVCEGGESLQQGSYYAECRHMPSGLSKRAHDQHARDCVVQWAMSKTMGKYHHVR